MEGAILALFDDVDVLLHPADTSPRARAGRTRRRRARRAEARRRSNLSGAPAVAIPTGFSSKFHMPLSMQCVGAPEADAEVLLVAEAFQQATDHHRARPPL